NIEPYNVRTMTRPQSHKATEKSCGRMKTERPTANSLCVSVSLWLCFWVILLPGFATARADELHLKDGRVIEAEEIWEVGDAIWYRQGKIIASFAKTDIIRITKPAPEANPSSTPSVQSVSSVLSGSRKVSRI